MADHGNDDRASPGNSIDLSVFSFEHGRFLVGDVERVEGSELRRMFLPKLTKPAARLISNHDHFVRYQLHHYGIEFKDHEAPGRGTSLLKRLLEEGKCDKVPECILELERNMTSNWLASKSIDDLITMPRMMMEKCFLIDGKPNPFKTDTVITISFPWFEEEPEALIEAASQVPDLHHRKVTGPKTQALFMGWDSRAVVKESCHYLSREEASVIAENPHLARKAFERLIQLPIEDQNKDIQLEEEDRTRHRMRLHRDYLNTRQDGPDEASKRTPVGSYIVRCERLQWDFKVSEENISLDIHATDQLGVFKAEFDFGVHAGVMLIYDDEAAVGAYCAERNAFAVEDIWDVEDEDFEDSCELEWCMLNPTPGKKRKRSPTIPKSIKRMKNTIMQPGRYLAKIRRRETGENDICPTAHDGKFAFDAGYCYLEASANLGCVGDLQFVAWKVSDVPISFGREWEESEDHSEEEHNVEAMEESGSV